MTRRRRDHAVAWFVLAVFVLLSALATRYVWRSSRQSDEGRFENARRSARDAIQARIDTYVDVLSATAGLYAMAPNLSRGELAEYLRHLHVQQRHPGIQGIGLTIRVLPQEVQPFVAQMRAHVDPRFNIWPMSLRPEYHAIVLLEPLDRRNTAALGYDMFTNPVRREAMERARDSGAPAASGRVTLVQEIENEKQAGFLMFVPIYRTGATPKTVAERRAALRGFVYAPFRMNDLLNGAIGNPDRPEIGFSVYDGDDLLFRTEQPPVDATPRFSRETKVRVANRNWTIRFVSARRWYGAPHWLSAATFVSGIVIGLLLFLLIRVQLHARDDAERTAERLRESERELQAASRAKDEFLATLSHELRTPMTAVLGWSNLIAAGELDEETLRAGIDAIQKSSKVQAQLIDDLLDVSRITAGKMKIEPRPVELAPIVAAAIDTVRAAADAKHVTLDVRVPPEQVPVSGDPQRLQQVVWNLLTNAVKFTQPGGSVTVELRARAGEALIEVRDSGEGIDAAFLPFVFERFRQADSSTTRAHTGLGLGLAIVRHLVEMHGGTVTAESGGEGTGATFRVSLPLLASPVPAREAARAAPNLDVLREARVLIVDDDPGMRDFVATVFRGSAAEVRTASSAEDALAVLEDWPADVVISDIAMPEVDGYALLQRIRRARPSRVRNVPVIALTALARPEDRARAIEAGFQAYVAKPVKPAELRRVVGEALASRDA